MSTEEIPPKNNVAYEHSHKDFEVTQHIKLEAESPSTTELRVLTLNVWCLPHPWPIGSKHRKHRLEKLAEAILRENYDIVGLQEVWSFKDYMDMTERLSESFRFHHYFHSGFTGSGVCVFSRHPIVSTLTHRYSLNGFAHHIHRGDWFGGKVVGLVQVEVGEVRVNFYATHLHAEYDRKNDLYLPHRTAQSFELSQFIRHTSCGADIVVVTGDLNMEPDDLGLRLILSQTRLLDAWRIAHPISLSTEGSKIASLSNNVRGVENGGTCDRPDNCYSSEKSKLKDESKRIDYIFFKSGRMSISLEFCDVAMNKIPNENINYSDHVALCAHFKIQDNESYQTCEWESNRPLLIEAIGIVSGGQRRARSDRTWFMCGAVLLFATIISSIFLDDVLPFMAFISPVLRFILTVILAFCLWYGVIGLTLERKALKAAKESMQQLLNALS
ncbi:endonuclease/exonuclease/phosphatase family protein [Dictyocaulus viviparus]|uniref:sphingomyelin phosphodiesterase n=1 Tax=Dictyocaulus viviparus TaxID=29172 RepID=A0A0D8XRM0_DICVI|nr:endonuclease/exonuclease/phosphatase family protein [Dictyocaulus viviparus]